MVDSQGPCCYLFNPDNLTIPIAQNSSSNMCDTIFKSKFNFYASYRVTTDNQGRTDERFTVYHSFFTVHGRGDPNEMFYMNIFNEAADPETRLKFTNVKFDGLRILGARPLFISPSQYASSKFLLYLKSKNDKIAYAIDPNYAKSKERVPIKLSCNGQEKKFMNGTGVDLTDADRTSDSFGTGFTHFIFCEYDINDIPAIYICPYPEEEVTAAINSANNQGSKLGSLDSTSIYSSPLLDEYSIMKGMIVNGALILFYTSQKTVHKLFVQDNTMKIDSFQFTAKSIITNLEFSTENLGYALTEDSVESFLLHNCASVSTCDKCHGLNDPHCGWCTLESKCSDKSNCTIHPEYWYQDTNKCLDITLQPSDLDVIADSQVLIGPVCADGSSGASVASYAAGANLPLITVAAFENLTDPTQYGTVTSVFESRDTQAIFHKGVMDYHGWSRVTVVMEAQRDSTGKCEGPFRGMDSKMEGLGFEIVLKVELPPPTERPMEVEVLREILTVSRVVSLFTSPNGSRGLMMQLHEECTKMESCDWDQYRFIVMNFKIGAVYTNQIITPWACDQSNRKPCSCCTEEQKGDDEKAKRAFSNVLLITYERPWKSELACSILNQGVYRVCSEQLSIAVYAYDTILLYAHALNRTQDPEDGRRIANEMKNMNLTEKDGTQTGNVFITKDGTRSSVARVHYLGNQGDEGMRYYLKLLPNSDGYHDPQLVPGIKGPDHISDQVACNSWLDRKCGKVQYLIVTVCMTMVVMIVGSTAGRLWWLRRYGPKQRFTISQTELREMTTSEGWVAGDRDRRERERERAIERQFIETGTETEKEKETETETETDHRDRSQKQITENGCRAGDHKPLFCEFRRV
eukprot:sb/3462009/